MSFASTLVLGPEHIVAANEASIKVVYLYGSGADCIDAFVTRETKSGSGALDLDHWIRHNRDSYASMSVPQFREHRVRAFGPNGKHRSCPAIFDEIRSRIK